ncbi:MOP flippase family protein [Novipirellula sp.]|uniref:MOP flippase family protein n=1 Tax=Novipirellula sp. TaxID=2795430 RepID=UPI003567AB69
MSDQSKSEPCAVSAVRWSAASKYGAQAVQFAVSLLLARLLAPEYFGLIGMATVVTGFASTLKNLGFNAAIIQRDDVDHALLSTLFWVNLGFCCLITAFLMAASPLVAWVYQDVRVTPIVAVLSLNILLNSFATIPSALLQKRLEFKKLAIREIGGVAASGITGVGCALAGLGVWSLVLASLAMTIANLVLLNIVESFRPRFTLDTARLQACLKFGLNLTGFNIFNYFSRNADNLIIGIFLGPIALGYYSLAYKLMLLPRDSVTAVVTRVLFPMLATVTDETRLADIYRRTCNAIALVTFPMMAMLAFLATPLVVVVLGEKWLPAVPLIQILAFIGAIQSVGSTAGQVFLAKGRPDLMLKLSVLVSLLRIASFIAGIQFGAVGVAVSYAVASIPLFFCNVYLVSRLIETMSYLRLLTDLVLLLFSAMMCSIVAALIQSQFVGMIDNGLCISICVGALLYIIITYFFARGTWDQVRRLVFPGQSVTSASDKALQYTSS